MWFSVIPAFAGMTPSMLYSYNYFYFFNNPPTPEVLAAGTCDTACCDAPCARGTSSPKNAHANALRGFARLFACEGAKGVSTARGSVTAGAGAATRIGAGGAMFSAAFGSAGFSKRLAGLAQRFALSASPAMAKLYAAHCQ